MLKALEADHLDQAAALRFGFRMLHALLAGAIHPVAEHALPGEQRELLKHRSAVGTGPGDRLALHLRPALRRIYKAPPNIEPGRFSAAGGPGNGNEGAIL